ncbi:MAG: EcsC family protein [Actinobacteria bacterium]|uniref:Unannotated protein n=1 Tax=freshwater metagenome TaxID=449393 RepID=A0A6J7LGH5_9ZZZZ|nr:EcsC family protein [Actinomycetota bacterium]
MELSPYEQQALNEIEEHKRKLLNAPTRDFIPESARAAVSDAGGRALGKLNKVPGFTKATLKAQSGYIKAAEGLGQFAGTSAQTTLSEKRVLSAFTKRGHDVVTLRDIRSLDLQVVEERVMPRFFGHMYATGAAVEGATAGAVISGGELLAAMGSVAGAGAGATPGVGTVATVMCADAAALLGICSRVVGHTAMYYGYDPSSPGEALFAMSVMNLGSAVTQSGKFAAFMELSAVTQGLARNATWATLNRRVLPRVAQRFASAFGLRMTKTKLGQMVPVVGIAAGAGLNYLIVSRVASAAQWSYRERFINEKRQADGLYVPPRPEDFMEPPEGAIDLMQFIEADDDERVP